MRSLILSSLIFFPFVTASSQEIKENKECQIKPPYALPMECKMGELNQKLSDNFWNKYLDYYSSSPFFKVKKDMPNQQHVLLNSNNKKQERETPTECKNGNC